MSYRTEIYVYSAIGNTPITKRGSSYCDVLIYTHLQCESAEDARATVELLIRSQPHGNYGHFHMLDHPNQNTRASFVSYPIARAAKVQS